MCRIITEEKITFWKDEKFEYASTSKLDSAANKYLVSDGFTIDVRFQGTGADLVYSKKL